MTNLFTIINTRFQLFKNLEIFIGSLHITEIYLITKLELKGKSGIYGFLCKTTGKLYIGSSLNLSCRFSEHINGTKSNIKLQNAINKYNLQDFVFIIFEYCEAENLILREQFYIDSLKPEYNILKVAGSLLGFKHTPESLAKMSGSNNPMFGKSRSAENNPMFGKCHSAETKQKMSQVKFGENHPMFGKSHSEESKVLMKTPKSEEHKTKISGAPAELGMLEKWYLFIHLTQRQKRLYYIKNFLLVLKQLYFLVVPHVLLVII
jgi:group I intron endonuclease